VCHVLPDWLVVTAYTVLLLVCAVAIVRARRADPPRQADVFILAAVVTVIPLVARLVD